IPKLIDMEKVDRVIVVGSQEAVDTSRMLAQNYGLLVGISSGANMLAALKVAKAFDKVITILPDRGERYLSMDLFKL
ncbi:MAG: cysteine synthase A, partial [Candidatus Thermoplasmatota archaeon]|nr:cysteine synthase A [Candidatus Thermoplasmatota archaeon]